MSSLLATFLATALSTLRDVAPIALVVIIFQVFVLRRRLPDAGTFLFGFACVLLGLVFFWSAWRLHFSRWEERWLRSLWRQTF